jgi:hypothetical protein
MECRDRIGTKWISNIDTDCRSNSSRPHLLAAKAHRGANTYTRDEAGSGISADRRTPLVRALALHGVSEKLGSHLGSTLNPGGAVLTLGVFRRSRSVAYIRTDASPSEVLAGTSWHRDPMPVKRPGRKFHLVGTPSDTKCEGPVSLGADAAMTSDVVAAVGF